MQAEVRGNARQTSYGQKYGETETSAWVVVNMAVSSQIPVGSQSLTLRAGIENLFDKYYATYADWCHIPQKGRNIYLNLSLAL